MQQNQFLALFRTAALGYPEARRAPDHVVVSWAAAESGFNYAEISTLGERGFFQVDAEWATDHGWSHDYFRKSTETPAASAEASAHYLDVEAREVGSLLAKGAPSLRYGDNFWFMVKLRHGLPLLFREIVAAHPVSMEAVLAEADRLSSLTDHRLDLRPRGKDWRPVVSRVISLTQRVVPISPGRVRSPDRLVAALETLSSVDDKEA